MADRRGYSCSDAGDSTAVVGCGGGGWADEDVVIDILLLAQTYRIKTQSRIANIGQETEL